MVNCLKRTTEKGPICPSKDQKHPPKQEAIRNNNIWNSQKLKKTHTCVRVCVCEREREKEKSILFVLFCNSTNTQRPLH